MLVAGCEAGAAGGAGPVADGGDRDAASLAAQGFVLLEQFRIHGRRGGFSFRLEAFEVAGQARAFGGQVAGLVAEAGFHLRVRGPRLGQGGCGGFRRQHGFEQAVFQRGEIFFERGRVVLQILQFLRVVYHAAI